MGGDGGSIPHREEMVRVKKKPEKKDKDAELAAKWKHCAICQEKLCQPIVTCELGRLYNKDKVIEFLLDRSKFVSAENFEHIKGLKDVKELKLTENIAFNKDAEKGGYVDRGIAEFMCPVSGLEMSGRYRFIMIWGCGCVVAERALKEIKSKNCNKCQKPFNPQDIIVLNGNEEDLAKMKTNMEERRTRAKPEKKAKKKQKADSAAKNTDEPPYKQTKLNGDETTSISNDSNNGTINQPTTTKTANGLTNGLKKEPQGLITNETVSKKVVGTKVTSAYGKTGKTKSIQHDPGASVVFKSLFTTSEKAKKQPKGPWVTHDPRFN